MLFCGLLAVASFCSHAEVFGDIWYRDSLSGIKKTYPKASYVQKSPAWLQEDNKFIEVKGSGLPYQILIHLNDEVKDLKGILDDLYRTDGDAKPADIEWRKDLATRLRNSPEDFIRVEWVRIVYQEKIPLSRFKSRYGEPSSCKFDESFIQVCTWKKRAMTAQVTDDGKFVLMAETEFTKEEKIESHRRRGEPIPSWLN